MWRSIAVITLGGLAGCGDVAETGTPDGLYQVDVLEVRACDDIAWTPCVDCVDWQGWIRKIEQVSPDRPPFVLGACPPESQHCDVFWEMGGADAPLVRSDEVDVAAGCRPQLSEIWVEPTASEASASLTVHRRIFDGRTAESCAAGVEPATAESCRHERLRARFVRR